jgi:hypothetical protein
MARDKELSVSVCSSRSAHLKRNLCYVVFVLSQYRAFTKFSLEAGAKPAIFASASLLQIFEPRNRMVTATYDSRPSCFVRNSLLT